MIEYSCGELGYISASGSGSTSNFTASGEGYSVNVTARGEGVSAPTQGNITFSIPEALEEDVIIEYWVEEETAIRGTDFGVPASGTVTIPAHQTSATLNYDIWHDILYEGTEYFSVRHQIQGTDDLSRVRIPIHDNEAPLGGVGFGCASASFSATAFGDGSASGHSSGSAWWSGSASLSGSGSASATSQSFSGTGYTVNLSASIGEQSGSISGTVTLDYTRSYPVTIYYIGRRDK